MVVNFILKVVWGGCLVGWLVESVGSIGSEEAVDADDEKRKVVDEGGRDGLFIPFPSTP